MAKAADRHVALIRGINVGGNRPLPMKDLAAMFVAAGCADVQTYIQSGNVVFAAPAPLARKVPAVIGAAVEKKFKFRPSIVVRSAKELAAAIDGNPFVKQGVPIEFVHLAFLEDSPSADRLAALDKTRFVPDDFVVAGKHIYLHTPNGLGRSKLGNNYFDVTLKTAVTVRNWRTVTKLREMASS